MNPQRLANNAISLIVQQAAFGPATSYARHDPAESEESAVVPPIAPSGHRLSMSSARSVLVNARAPDDVKVKLAIEIGGDGIVGVMYGKGLKEQLQSIWFW